MRQTLVVVGLVGLAGMLLLAGCHHEGGYVAYGQPQPTYVGQPQPVYVDQLPPPPPPVPDPVVVAPGPDDYVVPGYYQYQNRQYNWVPRHVEKRPGPNHVWVPPVTEQQRGPQGYKHVPAHWEEKKEH